MNPQQTSGSDWKQCPTGEIGGMLRQVHNRRRRVFAAQLVGGAVTGILIGFLTLGIPGMSDRQFEYGGITCREVQAAANDYLAGKADPELSARIEAHLRECEKCAPLLRKMQGDQVGRLAPTSSLVAGLFDSAVPSGSHCRNCSGTRREPISGLLAANLFSVGF